MQSVAAKEACEHALRHTSGPLDPTWRLENWSRGSVQVGSLRTAHPDFDGEYIAKNELMSAVLETNRSAIAAGAFPRSERIVAGGPAPAVMLERDDAQQLFVADGQGRVLSALWNGVVEIDAYIFYRPGTRTLPEVRDEKR